MAEDSKQAIPSPEDRVRAEMVEKARKFLASPWVRTYEESSEEWALTDFALSLVEELKGQEASASQQPTCPEHKIEMVQKVDRKVPFWGCPNDGCGLFISVELLNQVAQFFPAASAPEAALLRKRKDYHAEYVEAVEAAEKAERELAIEKTMLPKWEGLLDVHERLSESLVRQLEVTREALRKIEDPGAKVDSLMEARMIARAALTPEPATKAEVQKRYIAKPNHPPKGGTEVYSHMVWDTKENVAVAYAPVFTAVDYAAQMNEKGFIEP